MRVGIALLVFAAVIPASTGAEPPRGELTLELLMEHMSQTVGVKAHFREVKMVALLAAPLESRGVIYFIPPDRFARHATMPGRAVLIIDGNALRYQDELGDEEIDLGSDPVVRQFVENLTGLFNGDLPGLRKRYEVSFRSENERWELTLEPRSERMRTFVREIVLRGDGPTLIEMLLTETDGDTTTTHFTDVLTDHAFSDDELRNAFSTEPAADALATEASPAPGP